MASEVKVDTLSQKGSSGIVITDDIKLSSGKAIKNAAGTALLTQAGVLDNVSLGSSVTGFPAGHVINHHIVSHLFTGVSSFTVPRSPSTLVDFGSTTPLQITGISATEGNLLQMSTGGFIWMHDADGTYKTIINFVIDGTADVGWGENYAHNISVAEAVFFQNYFTVPASFTNKTIQVNAQKQDDASAPAIYLKAFAGSQNTKARVFLSILEIQA